MDCFRTNHFDVINVRVVLVVLNFSIKIDLVSCNNIIARAVGVLEQDNVSFGHVVIILMFLKKK